MAAVTVVTRADVVMGNERVILLTVNAAATGATFVTGLNVIDAVSVDSPNSTAQIGATYSGGTITIVYSGGGALSAINLIVMGK